MTPEPEVVIIDYGMGNMLSVQHACAQGGLRARIVSDKASLLAADAAILPGVGAFGDAMDNLTRLDLRGPLKDFLASGRPFLGICLGFQLLLTESEEFGRHQGLDVITGRVRRFPGSDKQGRRVKVPQVGWNAIRQTQTGWAMSPLRELQDGEAMYFVHSYYTEVTDPRLVLSRSAYADLEYCSSIIKENVFACQFHPEKSAWPGLTILKSWAGEISTRRRLI